MNKSAKIYIAGHTGMVGSSLVRLLNKKGYSNLLLKGSKELDLRNQNHVQTFFNSFKPEFVIIAAGKVGGIQANLQHKADFIYDNLMIQTNIIHSAYKSGVKKLLALGSSCIYPKYADQPIQESSLMSGHLESSNDAYAIAKIAGILLCDSYRAQYGCNFISAMPTNLYGPNDNYDLESSHVLPALLRKTIEAKSNKKEFVEIWGDGSVKREFLHVDDLARACLFLMKSYNQPGPINVGTGKDVSILELMEMIIKIVGFEGIVKKDLSRLNGTPRKLLDVSKINQLGWQAEIDLATGVESTFQLVKDKFI